MDARVSDMLDKYSATELYPAPSYFQKQENGKEKAHGNWKAGLVPASSPDAEHCSLDGDGAPCLPRPTEQPWAP